MIVVNEDRVQFLVGTASKLECQIAGELLVIRIDRRARYRFLERCKYEGAGTSNHRANVRTLLAGRDDLLIAGGQQPVERAKSRQEPIRYGFCEASCKRSQESCQDRYRPKRLVRLQWSSNPSAKTAVCK